MKLECAFCKKNLSGSGYVSLECDDGEWREFCNEYCAHDSDYFDCEWDELIDRIYVYYPDRDDEEDNDE